MSTWNAGIALYVDTGIADEPLVSQDANGGWRRYAMPPIFQGDIRPISVTFGRLSGASFTGVVVQNATRLTLLGKRRDRTGNVLFSTELTPAGGSNPAWVGELNLRTEALADAIQPYPSLNTSVELRLSDTGDSVIAKWRFGLTIYRAVYDIEPPFVPGGPTYLTESQCEARYARRDGPAGWAVKVVVLDGERYWAQKVGSAWVVPRIIKVGDHYAITFVEVP